MKKKSPRGIPDFSSKGPKSMKSIPIDKNAPVANQPRPNIPTNIKPPATSQKSGRRGS
ncbi:MAG: hypothetical protein WD825_13675 [Gemmatimonadaceae bacterium]